jgi:hypothetical protein
MIKAERYSLIFVSRMNNLRSWKRRHCVLRGDVMVYMGDVSVFYISHCSTNMRQGEHIKGSIALDAQAVVSPTDVRICDVSG